MSDDFTERAFAFAVTKIDANSTGYGESKRIVGVTVHASTFKVFDVDSDDELNLSMDLPWEHRSTLHVGDVLTISIDAIDSNGYHLRPVPKED